MSTSLSYRPGAWSRVVNPVTLLFAAELAAGLPLALDAGGWIRIGVAAVLAIAVGWDIRELLFRTAYELDFDGEAIRWRAAFGSGAIPLADLRGVGTRGGVGVLHYRPGKRKVYVFIRKGFAGYARAVTAGHPEIPVWSGFQGRLAERHLGRPAFVSPGDQVTQPPASFSGR